MNSLTALVYTLAITTSLPVFSTSITTVTSGATITPDLTTVSATVASESVTTVVPNSSSDEHTPSKAMTAVSTSVTPAIKSTATAQTTSDVSGATSATEISATTTSTATPSVSAQAFSHSSTGNNINTASTAPITFSIASINSSTVTSIVTVQAHNYTTTATIVPPVSTHTRMSSGSALAQGNTNSSTSVVLISSSPVKSTVTVEINDNTSNATTAPSESTKTHFSSDSTALVTSNVTAEASFAHVANSMVASMSPNLKAVSTESAAGNNYNYTASIFNTPIASSYISPSLVTEAPASTLPIVSSLPQPPVSSTADVTMDVSSQLSSSDASHFPKMSSSFVPESLSSATIFSEPSSVLPGRSSEAEQPPLSSTSSQPTSLLILTVTASNVNSSTLPLVNPSPSSQATIPTSTPSQQPTIPAEGVKTVIIELTVEMAFKDEYKDPNSEGYKELEANLTRSLEKTYRNVEGFIGIRILFIKEGSVICSFIVILAKDSKADGEKLKEVLEKAIEEEKFGLKVKSVKVEKEQTTKEKLPKWALITMIALGSLSFVFLLTVICVCVKYRRSTSENMAYGVSTGELEMHTYETLQTDPAKLRAKVDGKNSTMERRIIGSHSNPTYGSNGALADY